MSKKELPMFTFQVFCEGEKMPHCVNALSGLVLNNISPRPVENAVFDGKEIRALHNGTMLQAFKLHLKENQIKLVRPAEIKSFCVRHGKNEKSYSNLLREAREERLLTKSRKSGMGTKSVYDVNVAVLNG